MAQSHVHAALFQLDLHILSVLLYFQQVFDYYEVDESKITYLVARHDFQHRMVQNDACGNIFQLDHSSAVFSQCVCL